MTESDAVSPSPPPRRGRRALQAEQTRADLLAAARTRFARDGYAATSLKDIAGDAGVSVQTVYDSVGSKADLIRGLNDLIDGEAQIWEIASTIPTQTDPLALARIPALITRRLVERCGDILRAPKPGKPGPGRPSGSKNRRLHPATTWENRREGADPQGKT